METQTMATEGTAFGAQSRSYFFYVISAHACIKLHLYNMVLLSTSYIDTKQLQIEIEIGMDLF